MGNAVLLVEDMEANRFHAHGKSPVFDFEEYNGRYEEWFQRRTVYLDLYIVNALAERHQDRKKKNLLLSSLSPEAFHTLLSMGLTPAEMKNYNIVLNNIKEM